MTEGWVQKAGQGLAKLFGGTPPEPDGPPPPAGMTFEAVEAWSRANVDMDGWVYLGPNNGAVILADRVEPADRFTIRMRAENFATEKDSSRRPYRSALWTFEVNAGSGWMRQTGLTSYRRLNLAEAHSDLPFDGEWKPLEPIEVPFFQHVLGLCARARGEAPEGPDSWLDSDVQAWIARTVDPGEDVYSHWDGTGAIFVQPGTVRRLGSNGYALHTRVESFHLHQGFRSWTESLQLYKPSRGKQQIAFSLHPDHNLQGEPVEVKDGRWFEAGTGGFLPEHFARLWALAEQLAR